MSGACRETYNLRINPRVLLRWRTWKYNKRLLFDDNLMWLMCAVLGHRPYNTSTIYEKPEHACERCHCWLRHLDPQDWTPTPQAAMNLAAALNAKVPPALSFGPPASTNAGGGEWRPRR